MLVIRFLKVGKKNQPAFKIIVGQKGRPPQSGKFIEQVGFYNPLTKEKVLKQDRIKYWLSVGAQPSNTVHNLLVKENIIEGEKIPVHKKLKKKKPKKEKPPEKKESKKEQPEKEKPVEVKSEEEKAEVETKPEAKTLAAVETPADKEEKPKKK